MNALAGIPQTILQTAPRVWIGSEGGFSRRVIDPSWVKAYRDRENDSKRRLPKIRDVKQERPEEGKRAASASMVAWNLKQAEEAQATREALEMAALNHWRNLVERVANLSDQSCARSVLRSIAEAHDLEVADLTKRSRVRLIVLARQHAAYEIRRQRGLSYPQIGALIGGRDHTTILSSVLQWPKKAAALGLRCKPFEEANLPVVKGYTPGAPA